MYYLNLLLAKFRQIRETVFFKQLRTMLTGTFIGQSVMIGIIPVMSRLFTPADLAIYAVILAFSGLTATGATLRYELTIILPSDDKQADKLLIFCLQSIAVSTLILIILLLQLTLLNTRIPFIDKIPPANLLITFWPLFHLFTATASCGSYLLTRQSDFRQLSRAQIVRSSVMALAIIITGFLKLSYFGLLISSLCAQVAFNYTLWHKNIFYFGKLFSAPDFQLLKKYRNFPSFSLPMSILNVFSIDLLLYFLNFFTTPQFTGLYAKAVRVISTPLNVLSLAFGSVFFKKLNTSKNRIEIYNLAFLLNLFTAFLILSPLIFWSEELFVFFLGSSWRDSGRIATCLLPLTIIRFAAGSVSQVYDVLHKNKIELLLHSSYLAGSILLLWFCLDIQGCDYYSAISIFAIWGAFAYLMLYLTGLRLLKRDPATVKAS